MLNCNKTSSHWQTKNVFHLRDAFLEVSTLLSFSTFERQQTIKMRTSSPTHKTTHFNRLSSTVCWNLAESVKSEKIWRAKKKKSKTETIQLLHLLSIFHFLQCSRAVSYQQLFFYSSVECKVSGFYNFSSNNFNIASKSSANDFLC